MAFTDRLAATEGTLRARAFLHSTQVLVSHREGLPAPLATAEAAGFKLAASAVHVLRNIVEGPEMPPAAEPQLAQIQDQLAFQNDNGTEI